MRAVCRRFFLTHHGYRNPRAFGRRPELRQRPLPNLQQATPTARRENLEQAAALTTGLYRWQGQRQPDDGQVLSLFFVLLAVRRPNLWRRPDK